MQAQDIERLIEEQVPDARAMVRGDDGVHFEAVVISAAFAGTSLAQQHRMVHAALGGRLERRARRGRRNGLAGRRSRAGAGESGVDGQSRRC